MKHLPAILPAAALLVSSCATQSTNGLGGKVRPVRTSPALVSEGIRQFEQMKKRKPISRNASYNARVRRVTRRLARVVPSGRPWEAVVFRDPSPNAFALPGAKIGVNTGIFKISRNDAGLAAVLGHEMAHVTGAHAQSRVKRQRTMAIGETILDGILATRGASAGVRQAASIGNQVIFGLPHSRAHELEADRVGTLYMAKAGYDPRESLRFWQRFASHHRRQGGQFPEFLRTHPLDSTRLNALGKYLPTALEHYRR